MTLEVELKFVLPDSQPLQERLQELQAEPHGAVRHVDRYFNHPCRDFAQTDEALRIRMVGNDCRLTFKGPVLDAQVKTRREIELPVGRDAGDDQQLADMLLALGFVEVRTVAKTRTAWALRWEEQLAEVVIDEVDGLGQYAELELLAEESSREAAQSSVLRMAEFFDLAQPERRSYLRLLLEQDSAG